MIATRIGWLLVGVGLFGVAATSQAQFQSRWRDQRPAQSRPSPFLSLLGTGGNRAVVYQGIVRPQLNLQSQITTQDRQLSQFMTSTKETPGFGGRSTTTSSAGSASFGLAGQATLDRIRPTGTEAARVDVGHPVYFQYRDQYFPGFRRINGGTP
jgi:hypothetical protein